MTTSQVLALVFLIALLFLPMIAATFVDGFYRGSSLHEKCDAEKKMEAMEKLLRKEKRK